jgi:DNA polymerase-3 subunit gamma/tau
MVKQLHPNARDAAQRKVNRITVGVITASVAATLGIGAGIAYAAPPPKANNKTDYGQKTKQAPASSPTKAPTQQPAQPAQPQQPQPQQPQPEPPKQQAPPPPANNDKGTDKPESSTGDEETTSGGS